MNKEYIERSVIRKMISDMDWYHIDHNGLMIGAKSEEEAVYQASDVISTIEKAPTADVAPVVHAYWDTVESERFWLCNMEESLKTGKPTKVKLPMCSHCKTEFGTIAFEFKHCPNCGADMRGVCKDV